MPYSVIFYRRYPREKLINPLNRKTGSSCLVYAPVEKSESDFKYYWKDVPCDVQAPFICKHNPDFLGFHKLSNLVLDKSVDIQLSSMSITTCLTICQVQADVTHIAFILEERCICAKSKLFRLFWYFRLYGPWIQKYTNGISHYSWI